MENSTITQVIGEGGLHGRILADSGDAEHVLVALDDGRKIRFSSAMLVRQPDGSFYVPVSRTDIDRSTARPSDHAQRRETALVVPVYREEVSIERKAVETGRARITKHVTERTETIDEPLLRQEVQIDRVAINRPWEGPPPPPRYEADRLVIPLLEEVIVVEKRLMLKEELHISRVQKTVHEPQDVVLRNETVTVERAEPSAAQEPTSTAR
jgi:uncharacterized protein (TIGR02271 family)